MTVDSKQIRYDSFRARCLAAGLNYHTAYMRYRRGWTLDEALGIVPRKPSGPSIRQQAIEAGIKPSTALMRVARGWSIVEAVNTPPLKKDKTNLPPPAPRNTLRKKCVEAGTNYKTVWDRLNRGWPLERALSEPARAQTKSPSIVPTIDEMAT